jgi:hypothetical protein
MSGEPIESLHALPTAVASAHVVRADEPRAPVVSSPQFGTLAARVATVGEYVPHVGDSVLVACDEHGNRYVIGVLRALREATRVASLEHRPDEHRTVLRIPEGDLCIEAARGRVEIRGAEGVSITSEGDVALASTARVELRATDAEGRERSAVRLAGDAAELRAGVLTAKAAHLHALAERVTLVARHADTHLERLRQKAEVVEVEAGKLVERAKESYRSVEGLAQTQAGRIKLVAETTLHTLAERTKMRAKGIFAVDGDKIYLG